MFGILVNDRDCPFVCGHFFPQTVSHHGAGRSGAETAATGFSQANMSKHLQLLLRAGYVERRKEGLSAYYRVIDRDVFRLCEIMCGRMEKELKAQRKVWA